MKLEMTGRELTRMAVECAKSGVIIALSLTDEQWAEQCATFEIAESEGEGGVFMDVAAGKVLKVVRIDLMSALIAAAETPQGEVVKASLKDSPQEIIEDEED